MNKIIEELPIYLVEDFFVLDSVEIVKNIDIAIKNEKYKDLFTAVGNNYPIIEDDNFFYRSLYQKFYNLCEDRLKFTISKKNKKICWCYIDNIKKSVSNFHNHIDSSTINAVYYLNVPDNDSGHIEFLIGDKMLAYQPKNFDLLIFPNYMIHRPTQNKKEEWRVSINMEILAEETFDDIFI
jgi:hypothetical protein